MPWWVWALAGVGAWLAAVFLLVALAQVSARADACADAAHRRPPGDGRRRGVAS